MTENNPIHSPQRHKGHEGDLLKNAFLCALCVFVVKQTGHSK
jgi:hypothetical protein